MNDTSIAKNDSVISPLLKPVWVELYNNKWLQSSGTRILTRYINLPSRKLDAIILIPSNAISTVDNLHVNGNKPPFIETSDEILPPLIDSEDLH